jgi:hypothetical protein
VPEGQAVELAQMVISILEVTLVLEIGQLSVARLVVARFGAEQVLIPLVAILVWHLRQTVAVVAVVQGPGPTAPEGTERMAWWYLNGQTDATSQFRRTSSEFPRRNGPN